MQLIYLWARWFCVFVSVVIQLYTALEIFKDKEKKLIRIENTSILFFKIYILSPYCTSSLFFIVVIILVYLSTQKIGYNSPIKQWGNDIITSLVFLLHFSGYVHYLFSFFKLKANYLLDQHKWYVLAFFDHAFHPAFINTSWICSLSNILRGFSN